MVNVYLLFFQYFDILLTGTNKNPSSNGMEINIGTLNKIRYVMTNYGTWMSKDYIGAQAKKKHDKEEQQNIGGDAKLANVFETPPLASSPEDVVTSLQRSRMDDHLAHIETDVSYL